VIINENTFPDDQFPGGKKDDEQKWSTDQGGALILRIMG
jgi:hypothetical protein